METFHEASMNVYFIRHGQTDYSLKDQKIYQGFGVNLAPLSEEGVRQIEETAKDPRLQGAELILTSPYTRAVQTAAILSRRLDLPIAVRPTCMNGWQTSITYMKKMKRLTKHFTSSWNVTEKRRKEPSGSHRRISGRGWKGF